MSTGRVFMSTGRVFMSTGRVFMSTGRVFMSTGRVFMSTGSVFMSTGRVFMSTGRVFMSTGRIATILLLSQSSLALHSVSWADMRRTCRYTRAAYFSFTHRPKAGTSSDSFHH